MVETVEVGKDETLTYGSGGDSAINTLLPRQWGGVTTDIDPGDKEANVGYNASVLGIGNGAWAEEWTDFTVSGDSEGFAVIDFDGEYAASLDAVGGATARARASIFLRDITSGSVSIDTDELFDRQVGYYQVIPVKPSGPIDDQLTATLQPDRDYRVGVRAEVWAAASGTSRSSADFTSYGDPGYIRYSSVTVDWRLE